MAEILRALAQPSGNGYEPVDGPEGLSEAMGAVLALVFGQVAGDVEVQVAPDFSSAIQSKSSFSSMAVEQAVSAYCKEGARSKAKRP